ncbi:hypothetical protein B0H10DRAFT_2020262 [Mycena sp. CBHHK59/15]|nr:hypothetical protein B0H10DRAFT_2020262 [Mycena sp. CBHHK59/15]
MMAPSMADSIPDEIISEILSPALRVSDKAFSSTTRNSPFASFSESSSAFLLVSKAWLRVATPLLYYTVILRSKAQAQALASALRQNTDLGRFIKKLRVEGGYQSSMFKIIQTSRNISDLFLSLNILSPDDAGGLCRGLPLMDPTRVILHDSDGWTPRPARQLVDVLQKCIPKWKNLAVFETPFPNVEIYDIIAFGLARALRDAPNLKTLVLPDGIFPMSRVPQHILTIATNPSLQNIRFKSPTAKPDRGLIEALQKDAGLRARDLFTLPEEQPRANASPPKPFNYPPRLAADSVQEDAIWSRVLYFAMNRVPPARKLEDDPGRLESMLDSLFGLHDSESEGPDLELAVPQPRSAYLAPVLVSKMFMRLSIPYLYERPILDSSSAVSAFSRRIVQRPSLGSHVRSLYMDGYGDQAGIKAIFARTPALVELDGRYELTWKTFNELGSSVGSTLVTFKGLSVTKSKDASPVVFSLFPQMKFFTWECKTVFNTADNLVPDSALVSLENLTINSFDVSFLVVLSHMKLPSLKSAIFSGTTRGGNSFFQTHGKKLQTLTVSVAQIADFDLAIFRNCPSIRVLTILCDEKVVPNPSSFQVSLKHMHLESIVIRLSDYGLTQYRERKWVEFFSALDLEAFPVLREIQHFECNWPSTEREILKSNWVKCAEDLLDRNIKLTDYKGVPWKRRLKFTASSRNRKSGTKKIASKLS